MPLSFPPQLTGDNARDILALQSYLYDLVVQFDNAVGGAIDPTEGSGGDGSLTITEPPTDIIIIPSTVLSVDETLFGLLTVSFTLPARAVAALIFYKESAESQYHSSIATTSPYSINSLSVGTSYDVKLSGQAANGSLGPSSPVQTVNISDSDVIMKAPVNAEYVVTSLSTVLTAERQLTDSPTVVWDSTVDSQVTGEVPDLAITTAKLADSAVTEIKIADSAVTTVKLDDLAVTEIKIADLAVTTGKIADLAVTTPKLADGSVVEVKIADSAVTTPKIADLAVTTGKLADLAVTTGKLADSAVTTVKIADLNVTTAKLADKAVTYAKIQDVTALRLLGRGNSTGTVQELTVDTTILPVMTLLLMSGVYTPTLTNVTNISASSATQCQYLRVGATVTVSGYVVIDPIIAGSTQLAISLPIVSAIAGIADCGGVAFCNDIAGQGAAMYGYPGQSAAIMEWIAVDIASRLMFFTFTYRIL